MLVLGLSPTPTHFFSENPTEQLGNDCWPAVQAALEHSSGLQLGHCWWVKRPLAMDEQSLDSMPQCLKNYRISAVECRLKKPASQGLLPSHLHCTPCSWEWKCQGYRIWSKRNAEAHRWMQQAFQMQFCILLMLVSNRIGQLVEYVFTTKRYPSNGLKSVRMCAYTVLLDLYEKVAFQSCCWTAF